MAGGKADQKKRKRSRKARTEVSSSSSSSSSSDSEDSLSSLNAPKDDKRPKSNKTTDDGVHATSPNQSPDDVAPPAQKDPENVFDEFYLKQATKELANDLDMLRSAGDFGAGSVPILIEALKQGRECFTTEERRKIARVDAHG